MRRDLRWEETYTSNSMDTRAPQIRKRRHMRPCTAITVRTSRTSHHECRDLAGRILALTHKTRWPPRNFAWGARRLALAALSATAGPGPEGEFSIGFRRLPRCSEQ